MTDRQEELVAAVRAAVGLDEQKQQQQQQQRLDLEVYDPLQERCVGSCRPCRNTPHPN